MTKVKNSEELDKLMNTVLPIPKEVDDFCSTLDKSSKYYYISTIELLNNKLLERTFAVKHSGKIKCKVEEVLRRLEGEDDWYCRNLRLTIGGYIPTFNESERKNRYYGYDPEQRFWECKYKPILSDYRSYTFEDVLNLKPEYKYCGFNYFDKEHSGYSILIYINKYIKNPYLEMLAKLDLVRLDGPKIAKMLEKKDFRRFLFKNAKTIKEKYLDVNQIIQMFKNNKTIDEIIRAKEFSTFKRGHSYFFKKYQELDINKVKKYIIDKKITMDLYEDLIEAVSFLKLDLKDTKNAYPNDFMKYHDLYTQQMTSAKNKEIDDAIKSTAEKYKKYLKSYGNLTMLFPQSTNDFINEGEELHHCVGRMSYNQKMAKGESLIIFIRQKENIEKPFLTLELEPNKKKILQFYGDHDTLPPKEIREIIDNKWLKYIKRLQITQ